jgi:hypothetical protein
MLEIAEYFMKYLINRLDKYAAYDEYLFIDISLAECLIQHVNA